MALLSGYISVNGSLMHAFADVGMIAVMSSTLMVSVTRYKEICRSIFRIGEMLKINFIVRLAIFAVGVLYTFL